MMLVIPNDAVIVRSDVKAPVLIIQNNQVELKKSGYNLKTYEEVVEYLKYKGYTVLIPKEEYKKVAQLIPSLCPRGHNVNVRIDRIRDGKTCCEICGRDKAKQTLLENYGVDHPAKSEEIRERVKQTFIENYGVDNPMKDPEIKEKLKQSMIEKYGVTAPAKNPVIKEKIRQTNLKKYGCNVPIQNPEIRAKIVNTMMERYGIANALQHPAFLEKAKQTCLKNHGVKHCMQNPEILAKQQKSAYKYKEYTFPSGNIVKCQGYEPFCLDDLLDEGYDEDQIIIGQWNSKLPEIWYEIDGEKHRYFPDIFIPEENLIIEVKSEYTFEKYLEVNLIKEDACKKLGYNFSFRIYSEKGNLVNPAV